MLSPLRLKDKLFYGWVVVITFLVITTTILGLRFSFGVFFKSLESEFDLTRTATSAVFSLYMVLGVVFAVLGGWALDRYGPRVITLLMGVFAGLSMLLTSQASSSWQLFITYSLLLAIGSGGIYVVAASTVSRWFDKRRGLAMGIVSMGIGLAQMVMAPLVAYLISNFGWRTAYIVVGLIALLVVIPLSRLLRKDPYEVGALPDGVKADSGERRGQEPGNNESDIQVSHLSLPQAFRTRSFWIFIFTWLAFGFCLFLVMTHIVPHATDIGIPAGEAVSVISLIGGTSLAARLLMGSLSDRIGRKVVIIICALLQVGAMLWLIQSHSLWMFYLFALVYGFGYGGLAPVVATLIGDTFGLANIGLMLGVLDIGWGVGAAIGPAMGGLIFDVSHSYSMAFLIGAVAMLIAALLIALVRQKKRAVTLETG